MKIIEYTSYEQKLFNDTFVNSEIHPNEYFISDNNILYMGVVCFPSSTHNSRGEMIVDESNVYQYIPKDARSLKVFQYMGGSFGSFWKMVNFGHYTYYSFLIWPTKMKLRKITKEEAFMEILCQNQKNTP